MLKITTVGRVMIPMSDQDEAIEFYTKTLVFFCWIAAAHSSRLFRRLPAAQRRHVTAPSRAVLPMSGEGKVDLAVCPCLVTRRARAPLRATRPTLAVLEP
jgi:hypothetical protein